MGKDDPPNQAKTRAKRTWESLEHLGKLRDGILVGGSLFYLTGYGVWAIIAWKRNLGPLPVLDAQYFVAGLPVLLAVALGAAVVWSLREVLIQRWPQYVVRQGRILQIILVGGLATAALIAHVTFILALHGERYAPIAPLAAIASTILILFVLHSGHNILTLFFLDGVQKYRHFVRYAVYLYIVLASLGVVKYYVTTIYAAIPQALGGAKPRIAQIDVKTKDLSTETLKGLGISGRGDAVARSESLPVFFAGSATLVVQATGDSGAKVLMELPRSVITAIQWRQTEPAMNDSDTQPNKQIQPAK